LTKKLVIIVVAYVVSFLAPTASVDATHSAVIPSFLPYQAYGVGSWPESVVVDDFTGDGRNDVGLSTSFYFDEPNDFKLFLFAQTADGSLATPIRLPTNGTYGDPMTLAAGDLNGDTLADVALATSAGVDIFHQSGGTLVPARQLSAPAAKDVDIVDMGADGVADIVVSTASGVLVFTGTGSAYDLGATITPTVLREIEIGDLTGDDRLDVVGFTEQTVHIFAQKANGTYAESQDYDAVTGYAAFINAVEVAEITGDGRPDVITTIGGNRPSSLIDVFAQREQGGLNAPAVYGSYDIPEPAEALDMNNDGRMDLVTAHGGWTKAGIYIQRNDGTLVSERLTFVPYASHYTLNGLALGDVSSDGHPDIVLADYNSGLVVLRQDAAPDVDEDSVGDNVDNCPVTNNVSQADSDADEIGDACDPTFNDPNWDTVGLGVDLDIKGIRATYRAWLKFSVEFFGPISPASANAPNSVYGLLGLDTDQDPDTGYQHNNIGLEYYVDLSSERAGTVNVFAITPSGIKFLMGTASIVFTLTSFTVNIPLATISIYDDPVDYEVVVGEAQDIEPGIAFEPGDIAPNNPPAASHQDSDEDGIHDGADNCPSASNVDQANMDDDPPGDACDFDIDNDMRFGQLDNCPFLINPIQTDSDGDSAGDACDAPGSGNVDCDLTITAVDALKVLRHTARLDVQQNEPCFDIESYRLESGWSQGDVNCSADINGGGGVNSVDALLILRAVAQLEVTIPKGCPEIIRLGS